MLKIGSETSWERTDNLTASAQWKRVGDLIPSNHVESGSLYATQINSHHTTEAPSDYQADKIRLYNKEPELHAENTVTRTELSKLIVCFDHGASLSVKDISVADSSHSPQTTLLGNDITDENIHSGCESSSTNSNNHHGPRINGDIVSIPQHLEPASVEDNKPPCILSQACENSNAGDHIKIEIVYQKKSLKQLPPLGHPVKVLNQADPTNFDFSGDRGGKSIDQKIVEEVLADEICSREDGSFDTAERKRNRRMEDKPPNSSSDVTLKVEHSETAVVMSSDVARLDSTNRIKGNLVNGVVKTGKTNVDLKFHEVMAFDRKEMRDIIQSKHVLHVHNSVAEDANSEDATVSARSSLYPNDHADLNLSGPETSPGHTTTSSVSSDGSTTSTRSFAFPILQPEWNMSPVKMAKADRQHVKKNWLRTGVLCCKF